MAEVAPLITEADIDLGDKTSAVYPYIADLRLDEGEGGIRLLSIGTQHFSNPNNWQFPIINNLLTRSIGHVSNSSWIGLNEGGLRKVDLNDTAEAALRVEAENGLLTWHMKKNTQTMESWDLPHADELAMFLDAYATLPESFRKDWSSKEELGDWVAYHVWERTKFSHLMRLRALPRGADIGDPDNFVERRLIDMYGAIEEFKRHHINYSENRRKEIHSEACSKAGLSLPFDLAEAYRKGYKPEDYYKLHFVPLNTPPNDYFKGYTRLQRLSATSGIIFRNDYFTDVVSENLRSRKNVVTIGGGGHIYWLLRLLRERGETPMNKLKLSIGEQACKDYVGRLPASDPESDATNT
jgi:hypothetical protein